MLPNHTSRWFKDQSQANQDQVDQNHNNQDQIDTFTAGQPEVATITTSGSSGVGQSDGIGLSSQSVASSSSNIVFNNTYGAGVTQAYENCILSAEQAIQGLWTAPNSITINLDFVGSAEGTGPNVVSASNSFGIVNVTYAQLTSKLASHEYSVYAQDAVASLPSSDPNTTLNGGDFTLPQAYAEMLGLTSSNIADTVTLNTSYSWSYGQDVTNVLEHEISEGGMGRIGGFGDQNSWWSTMDLFSFNGSGMRDYKDGRDGMTRYFSYNGGSTLSGLSFNNEYNSNGTRNNNGDPDDFAEVDVFGVPVLGGTNTFSQTDIEIMDVLGWEPVGSHVKPTVSAQSFSVSANQSVAISSDITVTNPSGDSISTYWVEDIGGGTGHVSVGGTTEPNGQFFQASGNWSNVQYVGGSSAGSDMLEVAVYDATISSYVYSSTFTAATTVTHVNPTVTGQSFSVPQNQSVAISSDITVSNPSNDSISSYWVEDIGGGTGHVSVGGTTEPNGQFFQASGNWSNVQYVGGSSAGSDMLEVAVYDATISSYVYSSIFTAATTVTHVNPTVTGQSFSVPQNQSVAISSDITVSNPSNDSISSYWVEDIGGGTGHVSVGGTTEPNGQFFQASGNWSNVQYVGGSSAGSDMLEVAVYDATISSYVYSSTFTAATTVTHVNPTVTGQSFSVPQNQSVAISSDITVSNPSNDSISSYWVEDIGGGTGHVSVGGTTEPNGQFFQASGNWSNVQYVGGSSAGSDMLEVAVYDATISSYVYSSTFTAATTVTHVAPTVNVQNVSVAENTSVAASSFFAVANPSNDDIQYILTDEDGGTGYFTLNGVRQSDGRPIYPANLSSVQYVGGSAPGVDTLDLGIQDDTTNTSYSAFVTATTTPPLGNPPPPPGTTADMIMRDGANGNYEIYDIGNNAILAGYPLGQVGLEWHITGLGGFTGTDTSDMILRNSNTGQFEVYDIGSNNITAAASLGQIGLEWSVAGFGDFSSRAGESDMLMRNSGTGAFEVYDIGSNAITSAASMGQVGLEWTVSGFGDFSGNANETDMLMRNTNTGSLAVWDISDNQITGYHSMGQVGLEWQVAGIGDFSSRAGESDMLMRNSGTGTFEVYDIANNQITSAAPMGQIGLEWQVVGFGPLNGTGSSDMLMRNSGTGAFEVYDISHNAITSAAPMGQVGFEWTVAGIAADPPTGSSPAAMAQLMQAAAGFPSDAAAIDQAPINQASQDGTSQPTLFTASPLPHPV